uniref:Synaptopodin 2b n=1 Tax=Oryzias sinensis TaxID=183150 RepID=A0A8C7YKI1_9TELE
MVYLSLDFYISLRFIYIFLSFPFCFVFVSGTKRALKENYVKDNKTICHHIVRVLTKKKKKTGILKTTKFAVQQTIVEPQEEHTGELEKWCSSTQSKALVEGKLTRLDQVETMDALPETKGKGVLMFVQRRKRIDEFILEQEELSSKQPSMGAAIERQRTEERNDTMKVYAKETKYIGVNPKKPLEHHQDAQQTNNLSNMPKPLVPNRTARPFLGFQGGFTVAEETLRAPMEELKFKRPSPPNSNPKVWSPTGDIIASRDERIYVPAIKTGILPDSKRKSANKQPPASAQASERQNKGERRSYIEPEEDCFSLGAEACNFMQPRTIKLKNPPPVAPKPPINPACPPWMTKSPSSELHVPSRSPISQLSRSPVGAHISSSPKLHPQPTTNSWSHQPSSVSMQCHIHVPTSSIGVSQAARGTVMAGKGAQLFAKRQSRMEKFVVDSETVQAHQTRPHSPTQSLPNSWRYSSNIRAPPPLSYNPLLSPFYPPSAAKKPLPTSPEVKSKEKPKSAPKQLNALDIMKHQPYQLDSSLFKYDVVPEGKAPSPKPTPASKFEVTKSRKQRSASLHSSYESPELSAQSKAETPAKSSESVSLQVFSAKNTRSQAPRARFANTSSQHSSLGDSIASAFSPASLIARGARQMAPRPKFSAKKPVVTSKQWKPVAMLHSI